MKKNILFYYYNYYHFEAFYMNDSMGDDCGCSFEQKGIMRVPFYILKPYAYIKKKLDKHPYSQLITLKIDEVNCESK